MSRDQAGSGSPIPKVITGPVPEDYADLPEDERLEIAAGLADQIRSGLPRSSG